MFHSPLRMLAWGCHLGCLCQHGRQWLMKVDRKVSLRRHFWLPQNSCIWGGSFWELAQSGLLQWWASQLPWELPPNSMRTSSQQARSDWGLSHWRLCGGGWRSLSRPRLSKNNGPCILQSYSLAPPEDHARYPTVETSKRMTGTSSSFQRLCVGGLRFQSLNVFSFLSKLILFVLISFLCCYLPI